MNNDKFLFRWILGGILMAFFCPAQSQTDLELLSELVAEDQEAITALVLYPEDTRMAIFEATVHPEALIKIETIQSQTKRSFRELLEAYPQSTQEMIWDLTRYPGLIHQLTIAGNDSNQTLTKFYQIIQP